LESAADVVCEDEVAFNVLVVVGALLVEVVDETARLFLVGLVEEAVQETG